MFCLPVAQISYDKHRKVDGRYFLMGQKLDSKQKCRIEAQAQKEEMKIIRFSDPTFSRKLYIGKLYEYIIRTEHV